MSRLILLAALTLGIACQSALGQEAKPQPVARLIASITPVTKVSVASAPVEPNEIERRAFDQTNAARIQHGLPPFVWDGDVCRMARIHSEKMSRQGFLSHVTPDGQGLRDRIRAVGIEKFIVLGENIAYNQGYDDPGAFAVERWMLSFKHRANILSPEFRAMAIGSFIAPDGSVYLTQTFITR
ncbi:MAG TPA: CAP domain-containing protein [Pyrinomonadaceae bacterium]